MKHATQLVDRQRVGIGYSYPQGDERKIGYIAKDIQSDMTQRYREKYPPYSFNNKQ
jgi:hypothetical protein